jgi:hypothetical protein
MMSQFAGVAARLAEGLRRARAHPPRSPFVPKGEEKAWRFVPKEDEKLAATK